MVSTPELAGSIIRRIRRDKGMSRAELSAKTGISPRSLYDLETGRSKNFGLGNYLKLLDALNLTMDVRLKNQPTPQEQPNVPAETPPAWADLGDIWKLNGRE